MSATNLHIWLYKVILQELNQALPIPTCALKKQQVLWQREEAIKLLVKKLNGDKAGINITIELSHE